MNLKLLAILPDGTEIEPTCVQGVFHGTSLFPPTVAFNTGIPQKGDDRRLLEHANGNDRSAFRGSTTHPALAPGLGAAYWADVGGWVYQVSPIATWHLERELEGRVPVPGGFSGAPHIGESEHAVPSQLTPECLTRVGQVEAGRPVGSEQRLLVRHWYRNPTV